MPIISFASNKTSSSDKQIVIYNASFHERYTAMRLLEYTQRQLQRKVQALGFVLQEPQLPLLHVVLVTKKDIGTKAKVKYEVHKDKLVATIFLAYNKRVNLSYLQRLYIRIWLQTITWQKQRKNKIYQVPFWLVEATYQWLNLDKNKQQKYPFYFVLQQKSNLFTLVNLVNINAQKLAGKMRFSQEVFRAGSCVLLQVLLKQSKQIKTNFFYKIAPTLIMYEGELIDFFQQHFPVIKNAASLRRWWLIELNIMQDYLSKKSYSLLDLERKLQQILFFTLPNNKTIPFAKFTAIYQYPIAQQQVIVKTLQARLLTLSESSLRDFKPIINSYFSLTQQILAKKNIVSIKQNVLKVQNERQRLYRKMKACEDFLNLVHLNQIKGNETVTIPLLPKDKNKVEVPLFEDYLRVLEPYIIN